MHAASELCEVSRAFIRKLLKKKLIESKKCGLLGPNGRYQVNITSLVAYLRKHNYAVPDQDLVTLCVVIVGTPISWAGNFSETLPPSVRSVYAGTVFDAGMIFQRERPDMAIVDSSIGKSDAINLGSRFRKAGVESIVLAAEDDGRSSCWLGSFERSLHKPTAPEVARDSILELAGIS